MLFSDKFRFYFRFRIFFALDAYEGQMRCFCWWWWWCSSDCCMSTMSTKEPPTSLDFSPSLSLLYEMILHSFCVHCTFVELRKCEIMNVKTEREEEPKLRSVRMKWKILSLSSETLLSLHMNRRCGNESKEWRRKMFSRWC